MVKRVLSLVVCLCLLMVMLVGCSTTSQTKTQESTETSSTTTTSTTSAAKNRTIGLVLISGINSHCQELEKGVKAIAEARGDKVITLDAQFDTAKEVQCIEDLISRKVDGIVLEVTGYDSSTGALEAAKKAGILVAGCDQLVKAANLVVSQTVSDNEAAGRLCAEDLVKKMGEKGEVIIINIPGLTATDSREKGFRDEIAKYPEIKVVATANGEGLIDKAAAATESLLQAHPNVNAVFGANDPCALGALSAFESAGKLKDVLIYGVDGSAEAVKFISEGKMAGSVRQKPFDLGKLAAQDLYTALDGGTVANVLTYVDVFLINSDNVSEYLTK